jgi:hypothetical protein
MYLCGDLCWRDKELDKYYLSTVASGATSIPFFGSYNTLYDGALLEWWSGPRPPGLSP